MNTLALNYGLNHTRTTRELMEAAFHLEWNKLNKNNEFLIALMANNPDGVHFGEVCAIDNLLAATLMQWLGSPEGQNFIKRTQERALDLKAAGFVE